MSGAFRIADKPLLPLIVGIAGLIGMGIMLVFAPKAAAGGWLVAFVFWSGIPIGSLTAIMIHALTGGRWGTRFAAVLVPSASALPLMALLVIPVLASLPGFYPWTFGSGRVDPNVSAAYLNIPFFIGRTAIAFIGWTLLAIVLPRLRGGPAKITAALGLAFHALIIGVVGVDWILSLEPVFMSTSIGGTLAIAQLASAFAWTAVLSGGGSAGKARADLGALLLVALLGLTYLNFMAILIIWYGDLPDHVFWFVARDHMPWTLVAGFAFICGSVFPILALFIGRVRAGRASLRAVGALTLLGILIYDAYLVAPPFGTLSLGAALLASVAFGFLLLAFITAPWSRAGLHRWRASHGG